MLWKRKVKKLELVLTIFLLMTVTSKKAILKSNISSSKELKL